MKEERKEKGKGIKVNKVKSVVMVSMIVFSIFAATVMLGVADASPWMPHRFWGTVTVDGEPAVDGLNVTAEIEGTVYAYNLTFGGLYDLKVPTETPEKDGGVNGDEIKFYVEGVYATNYTFASTIVTPLDLGVTGVTPKPTITDWYNNKTKDSSTELAINESECAYFNATADQVIDVWSWFVNGVDQSHNFDSFTYCDWSVNGTYSVKVTATNVTNGTSSPITWTVTVTAPKPDLTVSSISINPGGTRGEDIVRVYVNESNNISAVVYNNGTADAGAFDVCLDADGVKIGCVEVASLTSGASTTVSIDWTPTCVDYAVMPGFPAQSLPVTINVTADCNCTDCPTCPADGSKGKIAESDEMNNMLSEFIPAIQVYSTYDVIGGMVNNGYKSKNFDCNLAEEPLTLFEYDSEIVGGGIAYNVSGEKISSFAPGDTSARVHHIDIPDGATVKKARLYVYWYDKWGNYKTYPTGCLADLSVTIGGTEFMPEVKYNDQKGFGYYHSPKGTYAYDVTSKVTGSGDYTVTVENIDPNNGTTLLGEMLYVAYEDPTKTDMIQLWTLEGNDYLMAADDTHGSYNYGVSPEEATATVAFPGSIADLANVSSATLITVVAQGMASGSDMLFNGEVVKTDAWDAPTEAYSGSKINVESVDVTAKLSTGGNNMGFLDNGTNGMQASNAILVVEYKVEEVVSYTINLTTGYNMISMPVNDTSVPDASSLATKIGENCTQISKWDAASQQYVSYIPGVPLNNFDIVGGEGYFVIMTDNATVTFTGMGWESPFSISLGNNYNMIGIPVNDTSVTDASSLATEIGGDCTQISKWDAASQQYVSYIPGVPLNNFAIEGGAGYFVIMVGTATVTFEGEAWSN